METVRREVVLPYAPEAVWPAVTTPDELSQWFGAEVRIDVRPGGRADFRFPDGTQRAAVVEEVDPPQRLVFRWAPFERTRDGTRPARQSRVEIELEAVPEGTRLRVTEDAIPGVLEHTVAPASVTWLPSGRRPSGPPSPKARMLAAV